MIDWDALLPERERANFNVEPPPPIHDYLGERGAAARQTGSIAVNSKLSETKVKIPGFIVPLVVDDHGRVAEFFLVHYFGACSLSFGAGVQLAAGDLMEISFNGFGRPLSNRLRVIGGAAKLAAVKSLA